MISILKGIFDENGILERFLSDNGPQLACHESKEFSNKYGFDRITTSLHFPHAHGFIERLEGTIRRIVTKFCETGSDPHLARLGHRATPLSSKLQIPAELLSARLYRSLLVRNPSSDDNVRENLIYLKESPASWYNQHTRPLPPSQQVRVSE